MTSAQERKIRETGCDVRFDNLTRQLYATDASIYQVEPIGVAFPKGAEQASAVIRAAADERTRSHHTDCCLSPDKGKPRSALLAKKDKPFQSVRHSRRRYQKSPLRRCFKPRPPLSAGCAGFASGCRSDLLRSFRSPGDWRASCPAAYRSTHGHRHVRNWAMEK